MRFRLVENVNRSYLNGYEDKWQDIEKSNRIKDKTEYVMRNFLNLPNPKRYQGLYDLLAKSIDVNTLDPNRNSFLAYLLTLASNKDMRKFGNDKNFVRNVELLDNRFAIRGEKLDNEWYYDDDLLKKPEKEFVYTINIADVLSDRSKLKNYFDNIDDKGIENLYKNGNFAITGTVKDAGIGTNNPDTIYGMIAKWTKEDGKKDDKKGTKSEESTVKEIIRREFPKDTIKTGKDYREKIVSILQKNKDLMDRNNYNNVVAYLGINLSNDEIENILSIKVPGVDGKSLAKHLDKIADNFIIR